MPEQNPTSSPPRRPPIVVALTAQAVAAVLCFGLAGVLARSGVAGLQIPLILAGQGVLAAVLGGRWGLASWWIPLQLVLPMAAGAALALDVPSWIYLLAFAALVLVFWNTTRDRVPLYLTNRPTWQAIADLLPDKQGAQFMDVGAGLGGTLVFLAKTRPDMRFHGVESAPLPFAAAWLRLKLAGAGNAALHFGDMWKTDLSECDVVYAFLSPEPMPALFKKVKAEMPAGSRFISNSFDVPGETPTETRALGDRRRTNLLIWNL